MELSGNDFRVAVIQSLLSVYGSSLEINFYVAEQNTAI